MKVKVKVIPCRGTEARKGAETNSGKSGTSYLTGDSESVSDRRDSFIPPRH